MRSASLFVAAVFVVATHTARANETPTPTPVRTPVDLCTGSPCGGTCDICPPCTPGTICPEGPCMLGQCEVVGTNCTCVTGTPAPNPTPVPTIAGARGCVYVANLGSDTVSVIDSHTNTVTATIPVGNDPDGLAVSRDGLRTYVANFASNDVSIIDNTLHAVVATIPVGTGPVGIATFSPFSPFAYIALKGDRAVAVLDTSTNAVATKIAMDGSPEDIAIDNSNPSAVYVTDSLPRNPGNIVVIDTGTNTMTTRIPVGARPNRIAINARTRLAYVTNFASFSVSTIDLSTNTVAATIGLSLRPSGVAITPDGRSAYLANSGSFSMSIIRTASGALRASVPVGKEPSAVAMVQGSPYTYVTNYGSDTVSVIARNRANDVIATIPVGHRPFAAAIGENIPCAPPTPALTPTPAVPGCIGDCNGDGQVGVDEILTAINIALGNAPQSACPAAPNCAEPPCFGIDSLLQAVNNAINGCPTPAASAARTRHSRTR